MRPIATVIISHLMPVPDTIKNEQAVTRIEEIIIPAAAKANIGEAIAIVTAIVSVIGVIWVAGIAI
ncbi:MAG: hypothetical protein Pars2KO_29600 [Parasphingorhabdus sp.]